MWTDTRCLEPEPFAWRKGKQNSWNEKRSGRAQDDAEECAGGIRAEYDRIKEWIIDLHNRLNTGLLDKAEWSSKATLQVDDHDTEYDERLRYTHQRTKGLQNNPRFIAAMQELSDAVELDPEEMEQVLALYRKLEAGEFGREAMIRHYGQEFVDSLDWSSGE